MLSQRGEAVVLEPEELRARVARVPASSRRSSASSASRARLAFARADAPRAARASSGPARAASRPRRRANAARAARRRAADVAERDERIAPKLAPVVSRDVQPVVACPSAASASSRNQSTRRDVRLCALARQPVGSALLDTAVPGTDVLADVAAVHLRAELARGTPRGSAPAPASSTRGTWSHRATPGSSSAPVGHASMQSVHEPQSSSSGGVASSSAVVTSVPSTIHEPCRRVISIVFLP